MQFEVAAPPAWTFIIPTFSGSDTFALRKPSFAGTVVAASIATTAGLAVDGTNYYDVLLKNATAVTVLGAAHTKNAAQTGLIANGTSVPSTAFTADTFTAFTLTSDTTLLDFAASDTLTVTFTEAGTTADLGVITIQIEYLRGYRYATS